MFILTEGAAVVEKGGEIVMEYTVGDFFGNSETMHASDLPTFLIISPPMIFTRRRAGPAGPALEPAARDRQRREGRREVRPDPEGGVSEDRVDRAGAPPNM